MNDHHYYDAVNVFALILKGLPLNQIQIEDNILLDTTYSIAGIHIGDVNHE